MAKPEKAALVALITLCLLVLPLVFAIVGCRGQTGPAGPEGPQGDTGLQGPSGNVAEVPRFVLKFDPDEPGCGGVCHEAPAPWIDPNPEGMYTLAYEANHANHDHGFDPDAKLLTLSDCFECHAVGTGKLLGRGNQAPMAMREIVHEAHLTSSHFVVEREGAERQGDCFTCHSLVGPSTLGLYD